MNTIKKYESFFLLILIFIFVGLITFRINSILDWFHVNDSSITRAEQFSGLIIAYTAIVVFWYTIETYKLRILSERNNYGLIEVDDKNTEINFAGLTIPQANDKQKFINISIFITNIGKGGLKILEATPTCSSYRISQENDQNPNLIIDKYFFVEHQFLSVRDTVRLTGLLTIDKLYKDIVTFIITIKYEDINGIYNQEVEFKNVDLDKGGHFEVKARRKITIQSKI